MNFFPYLVGFILLIILFTFLNHNKKERSKIQMQQPKAAHNDIPVRRMPVQTHNKMIWGSIYF